MTQQINLKKTPLFQRHIDLGGKMASFGGYELPIQYSSIMQEHLNTRKGAGLFDVSHLGEFRIQGEQAFEFLQWLTPNDLSGLKEGQIIYSLLLNQHGGIQDDILIYKESNTDFFLVVNAGNISKIDNHLMGQMADYDVVVSNQSDNCACIAIQGPKASDICKKALGNDVERLNYYHYKAINNISGQESSVWVSRTGYTGEDGFEIFTSNDNIEKYWDLILKEGAPYGLKPAGLGARNTLRLEVGNGLYGSDFNDDTCPHECRLAWMVSDKKNFFGKSELLKKLEDGIRQKLCGFIMNDRAVARDGYIIEFQGENIGRVTSGSYSPSLKKNIGLASVSPGFAKPGQQFDIVIHGKKVAAEVVKLPFVPINHP